jgi:hypothetical protein
MKSTLTRIIVETAKPDGALEEYTNNLVGNANPIMTKNERNTRSFARLITFT